MVAVTYKCPRIRELHPGNFHIPPTLNPHPRPLLVHFELDLFLVRLLKVFSTLVGIIFKKLQKYPVFLIYFRFCTWEFLQIPLKIMMSLLTRILPEMHVEY